MPDTPCYNGFSLLLGLSGLPAFSLSLGPGLCPLSFFLHCWNSLNTAACSWGHSSLIQPFYLHALLSQLALLTLPHIVPQAASPNWGQVQLCQGQKLGVQDQLLSLVSLLHRPSVTGGVPRRHVGRGWLMACPPYLPAPLTHTGWTLLAKGPFFEFGCGKTYNVGFAAGLNGFRPYLKSQEKFAFFP